MLALFSDMEMLTVIFTRTAFYHGLMEEAADLQLSAETLTKHVLFVNFGAIHVSTVVIWSHLVLTDQPMPDNFQCTSKSMCQS